VGVDIGVGFPVLSVMVAIPVIGALACLLATSGRRTVILSIGLLSTVATAFVSALLLMGFAPESVRPDLPFFLTERYEWIPTYGIDYYVGIDGISLLMVLLTTFLCVIGVLASWRSVEERLREYMVCLLLLETAMLGVFIALDLILFYVFWEAMLIPMVLLIGVWGGQRRVYAAVKFFLFTMFGSVLMLVGILWLYGLTGTFSVPELMGKAPIAAQAHAVALFLLFGVAFAIKVPMFPFHTWLPDAHTEAPTAGSILLAGVLLKMGVYGFIRFCVPFFPVAAGVLSPYMVWLAIVGILYGGACALVQTDIKRLVAYSSVSHLGFVMLGLFVWNVQGMQGAVLQMVNHGVSTGALFFLVGALYERRHTRMVSDYGGLWDSMPVLSRIFLVVALSSIGLPGLNGFVGEFLVLIGAAESAQAAMGYWPVTLAATGVIVAACYMLVMYRRVFFGRITNPKNEGLRDLTRRELVAAVLLLFWIVALGVRPGIALGLSEQTSSAWLEANAARIEAGTHGSAGGGETR